MTQKTTPLSLLIRGSCPLPQGLVQAMAQYLGSHKVFVEALDTAPPAVSAAAADIADRDDHPCCLRLLLDAPVTVSLQALQEGLSALAHRLDVAASLAVGWA